MSTCEVCEAVAVQRLHGHDLCVMHAVEMTTAVLTDGYTPGGYVCAAICGTYEAVNALDVSAPKLPTENAPLNDRRWTRENVVGANSASGRPRVSSGMWVNQFRHLATDPRKTWPTKTPAVA